MASDSKNPTVTVKYKPHHTVKVWIEHGSERVDTIKMKQAGTTTFEPEKDADWQFPAAAADAFATDPKSENFTPSYVDGNLQVADNDADEGTYNYTITIMVAGQAVTSDPRIINKTSG